MAARLQIVVDVDNSAFKEYTRHFKEYSQALKGAPEQWRKVAAASRAAANDSEKAEKSIASYSDSVEKSASFGTKLRQQTEITARTFHQLTLNTQKMAVHIGDATKALLTWSGIMGVVGGIASYATIQVVESRVVGVVAANGRDVAWHECWEGQRLQIELRTAWRRWIS